MTMFTALVAISVIEIKIINLNHIYDHRHLFLWNKEKT